MTDSDLRCPTCHSKQLHFDKNGYGYGNGCLGAICLGPFGLLCGGLGSNEIYANCLKCGKKFKTKKAICYEDDNSWECSNCGEEFDTKKEAMRHEKKCDDTSEEQDFNCPECGKEFSVEIDEDDDLKEGIIVDCPKCNKEVTIEEEEEELWECGYCDKEFKTKKSALTHEKKCKRK